MSVIDEIVKDKLKKVYALFEGATTEGEKAAAKLALDKILKRYNLSEEVLNGIDLNEYVFNYSTTIELDLLARIMAFFVPGAIEASLRSPWIKQIKSNLTYIDWITIDSAYEYFRRHMKAQWNKYCAVELRRCRKNKTKARLRKQLQPIFFSRYIIASRLIEEHHLITIDTSNMSNQELQLRKKVQNVEGGKYNRQLTTNLLLN